MVFWVICLWVQGGTAQTLKGKRPAIISTTSLDSNLSFLHQMRPLEQMDSHLIVLLWLYFSTSNDSSVYSLCWITLAAVFGFDIHIILFFLSLFLGSYLSPLFLFFSLRIIQRYDSRVRIKSLPQRHISLASSKDLSKVSWVECRMFIYQSTFALSVCGESLGRSTERIGTVRPIF